MTYDFEQAGFVDGLIVFPDYVFADRPTPATDIRETISIRGRTTDNTQARQGTADTTE